MIVLRDRLTKEEAEKIECWRFSLYMEREKISKADFDEFCKHLYKDLEKYFFKGSTMFALTKPVKSDYLGQPRNFHTKAESTKNTAPSKIFRFPLVDYFTFTFIKKLRVPDRFMAIMERGITNKEYFISFNGTFDFKDVKNQYSIPEELFTKLKSEDLILTVADDDKVYNKIYEFTDKYYAKFYKYFSFKMTKKQYHAIKRKYKEQSIPVQLDDEQTFYEMYGEENSILNPKLIKHKKFVDKKKSVNHFID